MNIYKEIEKARDLLGSIPVMKMRLEVSQAVHRAYEILNKLLSESKYRSK